MTDAIGSITSSTIPAQEQTYEQISLEDLANFESAYKGEIPQSSSINSIDETKTIEFSDQLLQHTMNIDNGYHHLFTNRLSDAPKITITSESNALLDLGTKPKQSESPFADNLETMMKVLHETHTWGVDVMAWSMHVKLLTTTVTTTSSGLNSLLKSGG